MEDAIRRKILQVAHDCTVGAKYPGACGFAALVHLQGHLGRKVEPEEEELFRSAWEVCVEQLSGAKPNATEV